jgi:hypothetical protein
MTGAENAETKPFCVAVSLPVFYLGSKASLGVITTILFPEYPTGGQDLYLSSFL